MSEDLDRDGAFEDGSLLHMSWWDTVVCKKALKVWVPTVHAVPGALLSVCADARTAVRLGLEGASPLPQDAFWL